MPLFLLANLFFIRLHLLLSVFVFTPTCLPCYISWLKHLLHPVQKCWGGKKAHNKCHLYKLFLCLLTVVCEHARRSYSCHSNSWNATSMWDSVHRKPLENTVHAKESLNSIQYACTAYRTVYSTTRLHSLQNKHGAHFHLDATPQDINSFHQEQRRA